MLGEPAYENDTYRPHPRHIRSQPWWTVLAGGAGYTMGVRYIAYSVDENYPHDWREWKSLETTLNSPSVKWTGIYKNIISSVKWWTLVPGQELFVDDPGQGADMAAAAYTSDKNVIIFYFPQNKPLKVDLLPVFSNNIARCMWFDPATGNVSENRPVIDKVTLTPPAGYEDAVCLLKKIIK